METSTESAAAADAVSGVPRRALSSGWSRIVSAGAGIPVVLAILFLLPPIGFAALLAAGAMAGLSEFFSLADRGGVSCYRWVGYAAGLLLLAVVMFDRPDAGLAAALCCLAFPAVALARRSAPDAAAREVSIGVFGVCFVALPLGCAGLIRMSPNGRFLVLFLLVVTWLGDTGAYYVGRAIGRHKLAPAVSPGKTVEGSIGGAVASMAGAAVLGLYPVKIFTLPEALALGLLLNLAGQVGDLAESLLKRWPGVKDTSRLIPGHGGFLDRCDSLLMSAPVLYLYLRMKGGAP